MKKHFILFGITFIMAFNSIGQTLKINNEKALVNFDFISEETTGTVTGIKATIVFDAKNLSVSSFNGTADVSTLSTNNTKRDNHLQQEEMFHVEKYPTMDFNSSSIEKNEKGFSMKGSLSIKGTKKDVIIDFTFQDNVFIGKTVIYSNDFDVLPQKTREASKVLVKITIPII